MASSLEEAPNVADVLLECRRLPNFHDDLNKLRQMEAACSLQLLVCFVALNLVAPCD